MDEIMALASEIQNKLDYIKKNLSSFTYAEYSLSVQSVMRDVACLVGLIVSKSDCIVSKSDS